MICFDCTDTERPAVAVCVDCGAAVCRQHVIVRPHRLTVVRALNRDESVDPPAQLAHCRTCDEARKAQTAAQYR